MSKTLFYLIAFLCFEVITNAFVVKNGILSCQNLSRKQLQHGRAFWAVEKDDNKDDDSMPTPNIEDIDGIPISILGYAIAFVAFWPLLALLRVAFHEHGGMMIGFDSESYMALKGILEQEPPNLDEIRELPPLSPAEQLVGALFGPPSR